MNISDNISFSKLKVISYAWEILIAVITFGLSYFLFSGYGETLALDEKYIPVSPTTFRFIIWLLFFLCLKNIFDFSFPYIRDFYIGKKYIFSSSNWPDGWLY